MSVDTSHMSDDELLAHVDSLPEEVEETQADEEEEVVVDETTEDVIENDLEDTEETETSDEESDTEEDTLETAETTDEEDETESQADEEETEDDTNEDTDGDTQETSEVDYKSFYEQVTADYKANGKMMPGLKNPDDFVTALSMASNYALKTTAMKPHMGRIKMLQGVSDAELNEMLDFKNRNPEVIQKALKEAGIDPLELDTEKPVEYTPKDYTVSNAEIEFEEVIESIQHTPEFAQTSKVVTELWDAKSKEQMMSNPTLIKGLNEEISMGRFDVIQGKIEQLKLLGKTQGMSDLELYQDIATAMDTVPSQPEVPAPAPTAPKPKKRVTDPAIDKTKAGISTKKTVKAVKKHDPTQLSDEEFMALVDSGAKFI